jgi:hypothetical protein
MLRILNYFFQIIVIYFLPTIRKNETTFHTLKSEGTNIAYVNVPNSHNNVSTLSLLKVSAFCLHKN